MEESVISRSINKMAYRNSEQEYEDGDLDYYSDGGWIQWFCNLNGHEFFAEIDEDYIRDAFNLYGLRTKVAHYSQALEMILSLSSPEETDLQNEKFLEVYEDAADLYGLIHYRFIHSPRGLGIMRDKFLCGRFGICPRVMCERNHVLPLGTSEELRKSRVKVYCPRCEDVYIPKQKYSDVDGAFFGCSFPHVLLQVYSECIPSPPKAVYIPKIYGFKVYGKKGSKYAKSKENS